MNTIVMEDCRKGLLEREQEGLTKLSELDN